MWSDCLFSKETIFNTFRDVARVRLERAFCPRLQDYLKVTLRNGNSTLIPKGVTSFSVSNIRKLGGSNGAYSFLLTYRGTGYEQKSNLVLKTFVKSIEPVLKRNANHESFSHLNYTFPKLYCGRLERCIKEFQVLRGLEHVGFPVPRAYLCEPDSNVLGHPFIIMQKVQEEELTKASTYNIDYFAKNLVRLHSLDIKTLGIDSLKPPEDTFAFSRRSLLYFKILRNLLPIRSKELKKDFEFAFHWLESNASDNPCQNYCLLHGDYRMRLNTILTKGSTTVVLDWESAEIGDPAYDVGYAYTRMRVDLGAKAADRFVQEYMKYSDGDIAERLLFYKLVGHLRLAILHSAVLSSPLTAYDIRGIRAFLLFPFLSLPSVAKKTGTDWDTILVENFKGFVGENLRR
jgi:aminoglycoside phosphotransferase (APT) family kinase protein